MHMKLQKPIINPLTMNEIQSVLAYIGKNYGDETTNLFEIGFLTGLRSGELVTLRWSHVDFQRGLLEVSNFHDNEQNDEEGGNSPRLSTRWWGRHVTLPTRALETLKRQFEVTGDCQEIFPARGKQKSAQSAMRSYKRIWQRTLSAVGISDRGMSQMRHSYATVNLMTGANPQWIAEQLGHINARLVFSMYEKWIMSAETARQSELLNDWLTKEISPTESKASEDEGKK